MMLKQCVSWNWSRHQPRRKRTRLNRYIVDHLKLTNFSLFPALDHRLSALDHHYNEPKPNRRIWLSVAVPSDVIANMRSNGWMYFASVLLNVIIGSCAMYRRSR